MDVRQKYKWVIDVTQWRRDQLSGINIHPVNYVQGEFNFVGAMLFRPAKEARSMDARDHSRELSNYFDQMLQIYNPLWFSKGSTYVGRSILAQANFIKDLLVLMGFCDMSIYNRITTLTKMIRGNRPCVAVRCLKGLHYDAVKRLAIPETHSAFWVHWKAVTSSAEDIQTLA